MTRVFGALSMLGAIWAGLYLLFVDIDGPNRNVHVIATGVGIYFIAKGLFMGSSLFQQAGYAEILRSLGEREPADGIDEEKRLHAPE